MLESRIEYPEVDNSVLNFGIPDLTGAALSGIDAGVPQNRIRAVLLNFEPRLIGSTVASCNTCARWAPSLCASIRRLPAGSAECADPYVERLLEGFAFLVARVQLKLDAQYPVFTQHLLEMIYPH
ncbi:hypothetical protein LMG29542_08289 [Paraburkholderia humisilvae]|uniref:IraD/Gp25-like domain-containing protein n=1 Tax=Paraburkholderia humisilvae TaxID=627669 RepID=A0A6J5FBS7_9BURK|nr:hypothetical protein LMG29542_08289 [Paraburkholderia humisilvae]